MIFLPEIETQRLILRELRDEDAAAIYAYFSQDSVTEFYDLETFTSIRQARSLLKLWKNLYVKRGGMRWGIVLKGEDDQVIGTCGYHAWSKIHNRAEIGYELDPTYWGQGLMTEAIEAIVRYGKNAIKLRRIEAFIDPANRSSGRVLEKVGMESEGILRDYYFEKGRFVDAEIYSIINKEN
ncbi:N-acetyltransferase [Sphingobacterium psychroaquaticum]|uniref:GNAT family N-acetyltransferase n=1 Tax=Sphingobacterium psychroaquaticum TaxID=561061 RepID=UPI00106A8F81|nr:GNAT family protein [Sphingobacterium psychroaquaticum]QBQ40957.1 N-acetyltransferase [Sphingobacterium psychroaquaticum]